MKIYSILKLRYCQKDNEVSGYCMHDESFKTYNEAEEYLYIKGYKYVGHCQYEIKDDINRVDYVAEIFISEINSL